MNDVTDGSFLPRLLNEVSGWESEGLISKEQAEAIRERYRAGAEAASARARRSRLVIVLAVLGAILVGVGVVLIISANWQGMSPPLKVAILLAAMIAAYAGGYDMAYRRQHRPLVGAALIFLGTLLYGASVFLIGQIYNIRVEWAHGLLVWGFAVLPLAYVINSAPIAAEAIFAVGLWVVLVLAHETGDCCPWKIMGGMMTLGVLLFAIGEAHRTLWPQRRLSVPFLWIGMLLVLGVCFAQSIEPSFGYYGRGPMQPGTFTAGFSILGAICSVGILAWITGRAVRSSRGALWFPLALLLVLAVGLLQVFWAGPSVTEHMRGYWQDAAARVQLPLLLNPILFNVLLAVMVFATIAMGIERRQESLVVLGLFFFGLDLLVLYFNWCWKMMNTGFALVIGGVLVLVIAFILERTYRRIAATMHAAEGA